MPRKPSLCLLLCFSSFALAQRTIPQYHSASQPSSSTVQVVYVVDGGNILTYNVDPQSLQATQVGTPLSLSGTFYWLLPSPNDRFLYVITYDTNYSKKHLFVYATDASGVPKTPATEEINANALYDFQIDPKANFLYAAYSYPSGTYSTLYEIERFVVDPTTGKISQPQIQAKYTLPNGANGTTSCGLSFFGFNAAGTKLYDEVGCGYHGGGSATSYERTVNLQTGALGPDVQIFGVNDFNGASDGVTFVGNLVVDFNIANNWQQGVASVNIYPLVPNTSKPLLQCTATMLEACGYASGAAVHPSGKYVFMTISQDSAQIDKVELSQKKIVDTGNYIPYQFGQFSPDGTLVYGIYNSSPGYYLEIFGFNVATSAVTTGGYVISVPSGLDPYFVAQRY
jgi:hypothetical protein